MRSRSRWNSVRMGEGGSGVSRPSLEPDLAAWGERVSSLASSLFRTVSEMALRAAGVTMADSLPAVERVPPSIRAQTIPLLSDSQLYYCIISIGWPRSFSLRTPDPKGGRSLFQIGVRIYLFATRFMMPVTKSSVNPATNAAKIKKLSSGVQKSERSVGVDVAT